LCETSSATVKINITDVSEERINFICQEQAKQRNEQEKTLKIKSQVPEDFHDFSQPIQGNFGYCLVYATTVTFEILSSSYFL
jgi:hypothetical protein